ncbi:hypothetical protein QUF75_12340 [Desulfococcaceae bacterium HSG7]|nr:hypothetical protein [Desulfococcaceae bacterium HSG7]
MKLIVIENADGKKHCKKEEKMAFLDWSDEYMVDLAEIDEQHKHLFDLLNKLHESVVQGLKEHTTGSDQKFSAFINAQ